MQLSRSVMLLLVAVVVVVLAGLAVVGTVAYRAYKSRLDTAAMQRHEANLARLVEQYSASLKRLEEEAAANAARPKTTSRKTARRSVGGAPAVDPEAVEQDGSQPQVKAGASAEQDGGDPEVKTYTTPEGVTVTTISKPGQYHMTATFSGDSGALGGGSGTAMLGAAQRVKAMSLTEEQRRSIEGFNRQFEQTVQQRTDEARAAVQKALDGTHAAQAAGDEQASTRAHQVLEEAMKQQTAVMNDLNKEYANGVKPYLTPEQAVEVDKAAQAPVVSGMAVIQAFGEVGEGKASVTIIPEPQEGTPPPPQP